MSDVVQIARLEAIAGAEYVLRRQTQDLYELLEGTADLRELAEAAIAMAGSLLRMMPAHQAAGIIEGLRRAAVDQT